MTLAPKAQIFYFFLSIENGPIFFTKYLANDDFSEPPRRADSKNPIFTFCRFLGPGHLGGPGVSLGRILGVPSMEPFLGEGGGSSQRALSTPPFQLKARLPQRTMGEGGGLARGLCRPPPSTESPVAPEDKTSTCFDTQYG